jgi:hypothetical protein
VPLTYHQSQPSAFDVINPVPLIASTDPILTVFSNINKADPAIDPSSQQHANVNIPDPACDPWSGDLS